MVRWYRQPTGKWSEAMPLGNGRLGAMVFGGIERERIALNDCTFWSGRPHDYNDPKAAEIRTPGARPPARCATGRKRRSSLSSQARHFA
jgi:hypothetical protein